MARKGFQLIGHDNPLGYPAPVVPIGLVQGHFVAIYASDRATEIYLDEGEQEFVIHSDSIKELLEKFDVENERLFGFSAQEVLSYAIDKQSEYFTGLLADSNFSAENPFMRLSLAKATGDGNLLMREITHCAIHLQNTVPSFTDNWYEKQRQMLAGSDSFSGFFLPDTWLDLLDIFLPAITNPSRELHQDKRSGSDAILEKAFQVQSETNRVDDIWMHYSERDETRREEIFLYYLPLVEMLARRVARNAGWADRDDLVQDGSIGLLKAIVRFDPNRGVPFKTFAMPYIRGAIFDSSGLTRDVARRQGENYRQIKEAEAELVRMLRRQPTVEEVAAQTHLTPEQINNAINAWGVAFAGELSDEAKAAATTSVAANQIENTLLREALSQLDEREALIVSYYYLEEWSLHDIARQLGMTVRTVTKIRERAIKRLYNLLGEKGEGRRAKSK